MKQEVVRSSIKFVDTFPKHAKADIVLGAAAEDLYAMQAFEQALGAGFFVQVVRQVRGGTGIGFHRHLQPLGYHLLDGLWGGRDPEFTRTSFLRNEDFGHVLLGSFGRLTGV